MGQCSTSVSGSPLSIVLPLTSMRRHRHRLPRVDHLDAPGKAVGGVHGDGADLVVAEVLLHLADHFVAVAFADADLEGVVDGRDLVREPDVDDRPDHLDDCACVHRVNSASRVW
jgi:hypothetical protein